MPPKALNQTLLTLVVCLSTALSVGAQTVAVNGQIPPNAVTVGAATSVALAIADGPGNTGDWIALYPIGAIDGAYLNWSYLSGTATTPSSGLTSATFSAYAPETPGDYEWRLFANNGWTRIATSSVVTVTSSTAVLSINAVTAPAVATVIAGGTISVSLAGGPGNATDWIGLAAAGSPDATLVDWRYLNGTTVPSATGQTSGTVQFLAPATAGSYELRFFAHNTFARLAIATVTVSASTAAMTVNDTAPPTAVSINAGTHVTVGITGGPAQPGDWVGLFAGNAADSANLGWRYLNGSTTLPSNGQSDAQLIFAAPVTAGSYEFRFFNANTFTRLATSTTMVVSASSAALSINGVAAPASVTAAAGSQAVVGLGGGPANVGDWVGLYLVGAADDAVLDWRYLNDTAQLPTTALSTATLHFVVPTTPGTYELRFFTEDGGLLSTSGHLVVPQTVAQISVNGVTPPTAVSVAPGSTLTVQLTGGPANPTDWVALAAQGAPNSSFVAWQYLNGFSTPPVSGLSNATLSFLLPSGAGAYELRLFAQNSYQRIATSSAITASTGPPQVTVSITSPFPGTIFNAPSSLVLAANVTTAGATIQRVEFYANYDGTLLIGEATSPPYAVAWMTPPPGFYELTAVAVDQTGTMTYSPSIWVYIDAAGSTIGRLATPIATPPDRVAFAPFQVGLTAAPGATIRYTLDGTTPDATSTAYAGPLTVTGFVHLQAIAYQDGWTESYLTEGFYDVDSTGPSVVTTAPADGAQDVAINVSVIEITFNEPMNDATLTSSAIEMRDATGTIVPATLTYVASGYTARLRLATSLPLGQTFSVLVRGATDALAATDIAGNPVAEPHAWSFTTQLTIHPPRVTLPSEMHARTSSVLPIITEANDPQGLPLTFSWIQTAGPAASIHADTTPFPSITLLPSEGTLEFEAVVSNGFVSSIATTTLYVENAATAAGKAISTGEGHDSDIDVASTSLREGHIYGRLDDALTITLQSATGAVLSDNSEPMAPLSIFLDTGTSEEEVTALFSYSDSTNSLSLTSPTMFRSMLADGWMALSVYGGDSQGHTASLIIPFLNARFRLQGTTSSPNGLAGSTVTIVEDGDGYRALGTIGADGSFEIDDLPGGNYRLEVSDGESAGGTFIAVEGELSDTVATHIDATPPYSVTDDGGFGFGFATGSGVLPSNGGVGPPFQSGLVPLQVTDGTLRIPQGTKTLSLSMYSSLHTFYGVFGPGNFIAEHPCAYMARLGISHTDSLLSMTAYVNGTLVAAKSARTCDIQAMEPNVWEHQLMDRIIDVSSLTLEQDATLRVIASGRAVLNSTFDGVSPPCCLWGSIRLEHSFQGRLAITSVSDQIGNAPTVLGEVKTGTVTDKFIGVAATANATQRRWQMRVNYTPANAEINHIRVSLVGPGIDEELTFSASTPRLGQLNLANVGFAAGVRAAYVLKRGRARIVVEIDATAPGEQQATARGELGLGSYVGSWNLFTLYDADSIPDSLRYPESINHSWGTPNAYRFLEQNPDLVFNDLSREHGGFTSSHPRAHRKGKSVDVRYFGPLGNSNPVNGEAGEDDQGTARRDRLLLAQNGQDPIERLNARREMIQWIRMNRQRMDEILADSRVELINIGNEEWNTRSLLLGQFPNGVQILDPDQQNADIGTWTHVGVSPIARHLSHVHIEFLRAP